MPVHLKIKPVTGESFPITIPSAGITIWELKQVVANECNIAPEDQRLLSGGQVLEDTWTLDCYAPPPGHCLHLIPQVPAYPRSAARRQQDAPSRSSTRSGGSAGERRKTQNTPPAPPPTAEAIDPRFLRSRMLSLTRGELLAVVTTILSADPAGMNCGEVEVHFDNLPPDVLYQVQQLLFDSPTAPIASTSGGNGARNGSVSSAQSSQHSKRSSRLRASSTTLAADPPTFQPMGYGHLRRSFQDHVEAQPVVSSVRQRAIASREGGRLRKHSSRYQNSSASTGGSVTSSLKSIGLSSSSSGGFDQDLEDLRAAVERLSEDDFARAVDLVLDHHPSYDGTTDINMELDLAALPVDVLKMLQDFTQCCHQGLPPPVIMPPRVSIRASKVPSKDRVPSSRGSRSTAQLASARATPVQTLKTSLTSKLKPSKKEVTKKNAEFDRRRRLANNINRLGEDDFSGLIQLLSRLEVAGADDDGYEINVDIMDPEIVGKVSIYVSDCLGEDHQSGRTELPKDDSSAESPVDRYPNTVLAATGGHDDSDGYETGSGQDFSSDSDARVGGRSARLPRAGTTVY